MNAYFEIILLVAVAYYLFTGLSKVKLSDNAKVITTLSLTCVVVSAFAVSLV